MSLWFLVGLENRVDGFLVEKGSLGAGGSLVSSGLEMGRIGGNSGALASCKLGIA